LLKIDMKRSQMANLLKSLFLVLGICSLPLFGNTPSLAALTLDQAVDKGVVELEKRGLQKHRQSPMVVEVLNYDSGKNDRTARLIQGVLFSALQTRFPDARLILPGESLSGVSMKAVLIKGKYRLQGDQTTIELKALDQMTGNLLAESRVNYETAKKIDRNLTAVLDIEASALSKEQRKTFSKVFRAALQETGQFDLISSDAVDRADADRIQQEYQCSREQCATIIAEQLNARQVITTIYGKVTDNLYYLTGSMKNIDSGQTLVEKKVEHDGNLTTLGKALEQLACQMANTCGGQGSQVEFVTPATAPSGQGGFSRITPKLSGNSGSTVASLIVESDPSLVDIFLNDAFGESALGKTPYQNFSFKAGQLLKITLKREKYHDKKLEFRLQGGMNDLGVVKLDPNFGGLKITTDPPDADLYIAGVKRGSTPYTAAEINSGSYFFSLRKNLYAPIENQRLIIKDGETTREHFKLEPSFGELVIDSLPRGVAAVITDNNNQLVSRETTPVTLKLSPGNYNLTLQQEYYDTLQFKVNIARGQKQVINQQTATLRRQEGFVMISTNPFQRGAEILVDGKLAGQVPANLNLLTGTHEIEVKMGTKSGKETVTVLDGKSLNLVLELKEQSVGGFVLVKGGCFEMGDTFGDGDSDEKPVHRVCVDDFYLGAHEVTQAEWQKVMGNNPSNFKNGDNYPVEKVSWNDAQEFVKRLNNQTDGKYRLPTEAEWEYACREGGKKVRFGNGKDIIDPDEANFNGSSKYKKPYSRDGVYRQKTTPVGSFESNSLGLFDMSGNVWEWTADWYDENYYKSSPQNDPKGPDSGSYRVYRGGSWDNAPRSLRCSIRLRVSPDNRDSDLGLRLARTL